MGFSIGGFVSDIFGSKNKTRAVTPTTDPNAYQYGGAQGGADEAANRYRYGAESSQNRQGAQAGYAGADAAYEQAQGSRANQASLASRMAARAAGKTPSIAGMQAQQDMQRAQAAQMAASASARGPAALALAQQNAANNVANAQGQISGQAQINSANERRAAEQAAFGAYGSMRGTDLAGQQQLAQQSQFNAQLQQNQHALNDQMQLGMTQAEMGVRNAQLGAGQNQQAQQAANQLGATGINAGVAGQNAAMNQQNGMLPIKLMQGGAGTAATAARGGPIRRGAPVIVGEEGPERVESGDRRGFVVGQNGPELIVPKQDGVVIPNHVAFPPGTPTWGTGTKPAEAPPELDRPYNYEERDSRLPTSSGMAVAGLSPGTGTTLTQPLRERDQAVLARKGAMQAEGIEPSEKDEQDARSAGYRERLERREGSDAAPAANSKKPTLASRMSRGQASPMDLGSVDVSYHGPMGGYIPPQLIPIGGARALGGPVVAGVPYLVGEEGPETMSTPGVSLPSYASQMAADPSADMMSAKGAAFAKRPDLAALNRRVMNPGGRINAFEEGGEAQKGKPAVVGEAGPEIVVEQPKEPTWRGTGLARAMASRKSQEGPAALPLMDAGARELHQSAEGHAFYAAPPTTSDGGASLEAYAEKVRAARSPAPAAGVSRPSPPPPKAKPRQMTPEEMMAEADRQIAKTNSDRDTALAAGPAVRMPVELDRDESGQATAAYVPSPHALPPPDESPPSPPSPTALPPPGAERWAGTSYYVIPKELPYTMSRRGSGGLARAMRKR